MSHEDLTRPEAADDRFEAAAVAHVCLVQRRYQGAVEPRMQAQGPLEEVGAGLRHRVHEHTGLGSIQHAPGRLRGREAKALERPPVALDPRGAPARPVGHGETLRVARSRPAWRGLRAWTEMSES